MVFEESDEPAQGKISAAFLKLARPLIEAAGPTEDASRIEVVLRVASVAWNAVVLDQVRGATFVEDARRRVAAGAAESLPALDALIARKRELFGDDLRLVGEYRLFRTDEGWRIRVVAHSATASLH